MTDVFWQTIAVLLLLVGVAVCGKIMAVDWDFVSTQTARFALPMLMVVACSSIFAVYGLAPELLWPDAHVYFQATEAWVSGANPWAVSYHGVFFGAPPPALLLNLPLLPFGEGAAVAFWAGGGFAAMVLLIRHLKLPLWWVFFYPIAEGWTAASPDLVLAALVYANAGAIAALTKPYSIPAVLSERRWIALSLASLAWLLLLPVLPWGLFLASRAVITDNFVEVANPTSAWGQPIFMIGTAIALVLLRWERGLALLTPALLAQQPHYAVFSLKAISRSALLAGFMTLPVPGAAAVGVMVYALADRWRVRRAAIARAGAPMPDKITSSLATTAGPEVDRSHP